MSKVQREKRKAEAAGKRQAAAKKTEAPVAADVEKQPAKKGPPDACCRCKSYKRTADDGARCKVSGEHVARKHVCGKFAKRD